MLTSSFFTGNRQRLRKHLALKGTEVALIPANFKLQKHHDEAYPFVQDSGFFYLTGVQEPGCILVLNTEAELLLTPKVEHHHRLWEGQAHEDELSETSGIKDIQSGAQANKTLRLLVDRASKAHVPFPYDGRMLKLYFRMIPNPARADLIKKIRSYNAKTGLEDLRSVIAGMRMVKQPVEIEAIKRAIKITLASLETIHKELPNLHSERELAALLEYEFRKRGADGPAFDSIVASGAHAAQIHYMQNDHTPLDPNLVLLDVGARYDGYAADISRTISRQGFTRRQQEIYAAVQDLQGFALSLLGPGTKLRDYEDAVEAKAQEMAQELHIPLHPSVKRKTMRAIPHAVSHHLGLTVHDPADYDRPLEPGMVLTVEPGLYSPAEGIGVRIEDDIVITKTGYHNLSAPPSNAP